MQTFDFAQYSPEWWRAHQGKPSASNFNRIITPAKWEFASGAKSYAFELIGEFYDYSYGPRDDFATAAMRNGTIMEPESRRYYEFSTGLEVKQVGLCISDCDRWCCSPDGLVGDEGGLELKHPTAATHVKWLLDGVVPAEHLAQCYGSLLVTRRKWWDFLSYYPMLPPLLIRVVPDDKMLRLAEALEKFWAMLSEMRSKIDGGEPAPIFGKPQLAYF